VSWDEPCAARHDNLTGIRCERAKGHPGGHEGHYTELITWSGAIDQIVNQTGHAVHGGWEIRTGIIVCAWDGEPIAEAPEVTR
jgi:hypothetical protein